MSLGEIKLKLKGVKVMTTRGGFSSLCPLSIAVKQGLDERVIKLCGAGCGLNTVLKQHDLKTLNGPLSTLTPTF